MDSITTRKVAFGLARSALRRLTKNIKGVPAVRHADDPISSIRSAIKADPLNPPYGGQLVTKARGASPAELERYAWYQDQFSDMARHAKTPEYVHPRAAWAQEQAADMAREASKRRGGRYSYLLPD
jgi:poly(3-hydroxybutyrate) depolymerase